MLRPALVLTLLARVAAADPVLPVSWGRLALYTAPTRTPPKTLKLEYVGCVYDETVTPMRQHCAASDRVHTAAVGNAFDDPSWKWAAKQFEFVDAPLDAKDIRTFESGGAPAKDPARVIIMHSEVTRWIPEVRTFGCESAHGHPCDPMSEPTGRKIRSTGKSVAAIWWVTYPTPYNLDPLAERLGFTVVRPITELLRIPGTPHGEKIDRAYNAPVFLKDTLAYLATAHDDDPVIAAALAYDRVLIAAQLRDTAAFTEAYKHLDAKHLPKSVAPALAAFAKVAAGKLSLTAPFDLETVLAHDPY